MPRFDRRGSIRDPEVAAQIRMARAWVVLRGVLVALGIAAAVVFMIFVGFPFIQDLITGTDPSLRYEPAQESDFSSMGVRTDAGEMQEKEMFLPDFPIKNQPYISGDQIIFTTRYKNKSVYELDSVVVYDTITEEARILENVEKKYDNLLQPVLSGNIAVWLDSLLDGGAESSGMTWTRRRSS